MRRATWSSWLLLAALCGTSAARAQDPAAEAQTRFREGVRAYERGDYERARLLFLQSQALVTRGSVLRNLALAELELGRPVDALHHLRAALAMADLDPRRRVVTENDIRDAYAATGHLSIETDPGATMEVDGEPVEGAAPFKEAVDVMPGRHVLVATIDDKTARVQIEVKAGGELALKLPIQVMPVASKSEPPAASAMTAMRAPLPATTIAGPVAAAGAATLVPSTPVPRGTSALLDAPPPAQATPTGFWTLRREIGAAAVVVGLLSTAAGIYFYSRANAAHDQIGQANLSGNECLVPNAPPICRTVAEAKTAEGTDVTLNYTFVGVGATALVVGVTLLVWPR